MKRRATQEDIERLKKLAHKISERKNRAFDEFFSEYWKFIFYLAKSVVHSEEDAKDVLDAVLEKVWRNAEALSKMENPVGWIYIVTLNTAKEYIAKRATFPLNEEILESKDCFREMEADDAFFSYIKNLSEIEQQILICKITKRMTFEEIALVIGRPFNSVTSIYYRALPKIENKLKKSGNFPQKFLE